VRTLLVFFPRWKGHPSPKSACTAAHRLAPPLTAGQPPPPAPTGYLSHRIMIQWIRSVPPRAKPPSAGQRSLDFAILQRKPRVSLDLQAGPPTVIVFLQIDPGFFVLAQKV
jgi:hypothetical protein